MVSVCSHQAENSLFDPALFPQVEGTGTGTGTGDENGARDLALVQMQDWPMKFEKLQKLIVELWHDCNVSLVHRTYFILLIKEDFTDSIYMEVEYRRLSFLKDTFSGGNSVIQDGRTLTLASRYVYILIHISFISHEFATLSLCRVKWPSNMASNFIEFDNLYI